MLDDRQPNYLESGSGAEGGQNPDVFWFRAGEDTATSRVLFEVGISQSLSCLRRRAYSLCSSEEGSAWTHLKYVVLIKRYKVARLYVEIWKRIPSVLNAPKSDELFRNDQLSPQDIGLTHTMEFVSNAHASNVTGDQHQRAWSWQQKVSGQCVIPAGDELLIGGAAVSFQSQTILDKCQFKDQRDAP